jgi:signal transduction histidine kinase/ActR/RegA family two-component response regulator
MPAMPLRRRLLALTAVAILPLAVLAGIGLYVLARQQRAESERAGIELARSVATAVDADLRSSIAVVEALATTPTLDRDDLAAFRLRAERVLTLQAHWAAIGLADGAGNSLVDTRYPPEVALPPLAERPSFERALRLRAPVVGGLARGGPGEWQFAVRVPVVRGGAVRYVVTALIRPEQVRDLVARQRVPSDWVISIMDADGLRVARSRSHEANLGGRLSASAQRVLTEGGAAEGGGLSYSLEGERIFTPYSRLSPSGWTAVLGIPTRSAEWAAYRSLAVYGGGVLLSIALGGAGALSVAHSINRPMAALRAAAHALGRREEPRTPVTGVQEIREVGQALTAAAAALAAGEAEREALLEKERRARENAEAADRAKDEFMGVLSHELRTPLNAVYGWARMLQGGQVASDPATTARALDAIVRNADVQVRLIDDLLDIARITSGKLRLDVRAVDLASVVGAALETVRPAADAKRIRVELLLDPQAGPVTGDPARLQQVVWNLLMNAVKFTPRDGRIDVHLRRAGSQVEVVIGDTGQGIAPEMLPHVFERFRQADSSSTRAHGGLGLGLALVKHLVELHGGTVAARSAGVGRGATFAVALPLRSPDLPDGPVARGPKGAAGAPDLQRLARLDGLRVLVVDDDADAVRLAEAILTAAGARVRSCHDAGTALALIAAERPDVLVSDVEMPVEDGYALVRRLRALPREQGGDTPAIALTAYGRTQDRVRALAAGYTMHVPKPVDPGELTTIVASAAEARRAGAPTA